MKPKANHPWRRRFKDIPDHVGSLYSKKDTGDHWDEKPDEAKMKYLNYFQADSKRIKSKPKPIKRP